MNIFSFYKSVAVLGLLTLFGCVFVSYAEDSSTSGKSVFADYDQDGLSNEEERSYGTDPYKADTDGDGYSDYVEVSSGYDPLKPAPGDRLVKEEIPAVVLEENQDGDKNLTQEVATKLAGVMQANAAQGQTLTLADIDTVVNESIQTSDQAPTMPEVDVKRIKIKEESYKKLSEEERKEKIKEDVQEYMSSVAYVFATQFPEFTFSGKEKPEDLVQQVPMRLMQSFLSGNERELNAFAEKAKKSTEQLYEIEVPESLFDLHVRGIQFSEYAQEIKKTIKIDARDPLESISNLSLAQGLLVSAQEFFNDAQNRLNDLGIEATSFNFSQKE